MHRLIKAAPLLAAGFAAPAFAAEHEVIVFTGGYFPETIYAVPGDTIRFVNAGGLTAMVAATDESWVSSLPNLDGETVVDVVSGMSKEYSAPLATNEDDDDDDDDSAVVPVGYIEWEAPAPTGF